MEEWEKREKAQPYLLLRAQHHGAPLFAQDMAVAIDGIQFLLLTSGDATSIFIQNDGPRVSVAQRAIKRLLGEDVRYLFQREDMGPPRFAVRMILTQSNRVMFEHRFHEEKAADAYYAREQKHVEGHHYELERVDLAPPTAERSL